MDGVLLKFDMFVVGLIDNELRLFPKNFTDNGLGDYKVKLTTGNITSLRIFTTGAEGKGLVIKDVACYTKLVDAFKLIKTPGMIHTIENKLENVPVSGFLLDI